MSDIILLGFPVKLKGELYAVEPIEVDPTSNYI